MNNSIGTFHSLCLRIIKERLEHTPNSDIVDFYNNWMATTDGARFRFRWNRFRYDKTIEPHAMTTLKSPAVVNGRIDTQTEWFFNSYLRFLYDGGISEYEDDAEYAPSGCVSFLTIHQSKGMEFPIVFVDSLGNIPRKSYYETCSLQY